jgi:hypothetical protein
LRKVFKKPEFCRHPNYSSLTTVDSYFFGKKKIFSIFHLLLPDRNTIFLLFFYKATLYNPSIYTYLRWKREQSIMSSSGAPNTGNVPSTAPPTTGASGAAAAANPPAPAPPPPPAAAVPTKASTASNKSSSSKKSSTTAKKPSASKKKSSTAASSSTNPKPARKKTTAVSKKESVSAETIYADANAAQTDLLQQRSLAAARRSDPLWYRIEDCYCLPGSSSLTDGSSLNAEIFPEQFEIVENALMHCGLSRADVTPQAMACLLEQTRRHAYSLEMAAHEFAAYANHNNPYPGAADYKLAVEMGPQKAAVSAQLIRLNLAARKINRSVLPAIPHRCHTGVVLLPSQPNALTARTFDIVSAGTVSGKMVTRFPESSAAVPPTASTAAQSGTTSTSNKKQRTSGPTSSSTTKPYGAKTGRQIPIKLSSSAAAAAAASTKAPTATSTNQ